MIRYFRFAALCLTAMGAAPGPEPVAAPVAKSEFQSPSKYTLTYGVEWRLIRAGVARMQWSTTGSGYQADLHLESAGLVSKLYRVNDDYKAQMSRELCATGISLMAEEGNRRRETKIGFDAAAGKVNYTERDLVKNSVVLTRELQTPPCVYEYLGALHHLRGIRLDPGQSTTVPLTDGKKFAIVRAEAQEKEQLKTPLGAFSTVRYELHIFNDVIIPRKARMYVWLTDDARRLPVQMRIRMQFLTGTINLHLEKEEHQ